MTVNQESLRLATIAAQAADEKQAENIIVLDVSDVLAISDAFVIASADNERQVRAIVEEVDEKLSAAGIEPLRREGIRENRWVLLDYGIVVVHIQRNVEREFYGLDRLYRDCPVITIEGLPEATRPGELGDEVNLRTVSSIDEIPLATEEPGVEEQ